MCSRNLFRLFSVSSQIHILTWAETLWELSLWWRRHTKTFKKKEQNKQHRKSERFSRKFTQFLLKNDVHLLCLSLREHLSIIIHHVVPPGYVTCSYTYIQFFLWEIELKLVIQKLFVASFMNLSGSQYWAVTLSEVQAAFFFYLSCELSFDVNVFFKIKYANMQFLAYVQDWAIGGGNIMLMLLSHWSLTMLLWWWRRL